MAGLQVVTLPTDKDGGVGLDVFKEQVLVSSVLVSYDQYMIAFVNMTTLYHVAFSLYAMGHPLLIVFLRFNNVTLSFPRAPLLELFLVNCSILDQDTSRVTINFLLEIWSRI